MKAPILPQKKEDTETQKDTLKPQMIFKKQKTQAKHKLDMKEMSTFNMKRIDLLHKLNEESYNTLRYKILADKNINFLQAKG